MISRIRGFTILELLMVIVIIGILACVVQVNLQSAIEQARIAKILHFDGEVLHVLGVQKIFEMDFNSNTYADTSGINGYSITQNQFGPYYINGISGKYVQGAGFHIQNSSQLSSLGDKDNYTVSFFFKTNFVGGYSNEIAFFTTDVGGGCAPGAWSVYIIGSPGVMMARFGTNPTNKVLSSKTQNLSDYKWHHFMFTRNYTMRTAKLYIDGVLEDSTSTVGMDENFTNACWSNPRMEFWDFNTFHFDNIRVYHEAY